MTEYYKCASSGFIHYVVGQSERFHMFGWWIDDLKIELEFAAKYGYDTIITYKE